MNFDWLYGVANPEWWRFFEHAGWVMFEDIFVMWACFLRLREIDAAATRRAEVDYLSEQEQLKTAELEMALAEMQATA